MGELILKSLVQIRNLRLREAKYLTQGPIATQ